MPNAMIEAIKANNKTKVIELLNNDSFDPNQLDEIGMTPLLYAVTSELEDFVEVLLTTNNKVSPNIATPQGTTPLMVATLRNNTKIMNALLDHKPPADLYAAKKDNKITVRATSQNEGYQFLASLVPGLPAPSGGLNTAIDYAAALNKIAALTLLLEKNKMEKQADLNHALLLAATFCSQGAAELLIQSGANVKHPDLLMCALESSPESMTDKRVDFVERLITLGMDTREWTYNQNTTIGLKILYLHHIMLEKTMAQLNAPVFENYMSDLTEWMQQGSLSEKNRNTCAALVARISYAKHLHSEEKDEMNLWKSCQLWANVKNDKSLDPIDKKLLSDNIAKPPLWMRGSHFKKIIDNGHLGRDEKMPNLGIDLTKINTLIDKTLTYLTTRYKETGTKCLGYSARDYVSRHDIADTLTGAKINYEKSGDVAHLNEMKNVIESALTRSEIKGRFFFSSHRFADGLREILNEVNTTIQSAAITSAAKKHSVAAV